MSVEANTKKNVMFSVEHLSKSLGEREILHDITFEAYAAPMLVPDMPCTAPIIEANGTPVRTFATSGFCIVVCNM